LLAETNNIYLTTDLTKVVLFIYILFISALSVDIFSIGMVSSFLLKKLETSTLVKTSLSVISIVPVSVLLGMLTGQFGISYLQLHSAWFAASLFFLLSLKMVFDAFRFSRLKKEINPLDIKGLFILSFSIGVNGFLGGLSLGLLNFPAKNIIITIPLFLVIVISSLFAGLKINRLYNLYGEWVVAGISLICALLILFNQ
jgi:putative Mn2+ efflux pump MntP